MAGGEVRRRYVDTKTRYEGVYARHSLYCDLGIGKKRCTCEPTYYGTVWDNSIGRNRRTKRVPLISEARNLRTDLLAEVRSGAVVERTKGIRLEDAHREFIADCRAGVALNKRRKPYTTNSIDDLDSSLKRLPKRIRRKCLDQITEGELQLAVDDLGREGLSASRINSVFNSLRSLYRWAISRGKAKQNAAGSLELPAEKAKKEVRIATPGEFAYLLEKLEPQDALPWALAGYATARSQEIRVLEWLEVDFENDVVLLAGSEEARKSEAARRIVPLVRPLRTRLHAEWVRQGKPKAGLVCPPRAASKSGLISLNQLQKRRKEIWISLDLEPLGLHDSRHTAATWMDHAGVSPKVVSVVMGHKAPGRQLDAAPITLQRYTHVLPGELQRAMRQLDEFLAERLKEEEGRQNFNR
ncbi:MAG: tyrosine-type recombinase/integrase [Thermoleophilia bacterium]